jgi:YXWGXW repeat-containing protein
MFMFGTGCSGSLPVPPSTTHPPRAYVEVPYPPPAALVEVVPEEPPGSPVWLDGHWMWRGRYYVWQRGGWVLVPAEAAYADWQCVLAEDGRLLFAPGTWYDPTGNPVAAPKSLTVARTPPNQITPETESAR